MLQMIEKNMLSTQLVVLVHHLPSRQFTFHANQIHILGLPISKEESFYKGAMVKQIDTPQTALTARVVIMRTDTSEFEDLQRRWDEPVRVYISY